MSKRKRWPAAEKLRIVLAGMQPNVEVSELCRREGCTAPLKLDHKMAFLSSYTGYVR